MRSVLVVALLVPLLAGCGAEDDTQRFAREAVESYLANNPAYDTGDVRCTSNPRLWYVERQASVVICAARKTAGGCDWFRVDLVPVASAMTTKIRLQSADAGCVLPP
jgi:hypothetical protein